MKGYLALLRRNVPLMHGSELRGNSGRVFDILVLSAGAVDPVSGCVVAIVVYAKPLEQMCVFQVKRQRT